MTSYFPLLPSIQSIHLDKNIYSSTTFLNRPNNLRKLNHTRYARQSIYLGTYKIEQGVWKIISIDECKYGEFVEIRRKYITEQPDQMVVSVVNHENLFPESTRFLPSPQSLRIDSSLGAERASLNYHFGVGTTSYQGEYPFAMSNLQKSSFWSFDAFKEKNSEQNSFESFLILMNINRDAEENSEVNLEIYSPLHSKKKLQQTTHKNSFTIIDLKDVNRKLGSEQLDQIFFIQCKSCAFIPMILSVDVNTNQLSFEHTHPPIELLWGRDKFSVTNLIKKRWLSN